MSPLQQEFITRFLGRHRRTFRHGELSRSILSSRSSRFVLRPSLMVSDKQGHLLQSTVQQLTKYRILFLQYPRVPRIYATSRSRCTWHLGMPGSSISCTCSISRHSRPWVQYYDDCAQLISSSCPAQSFSPPETAETEDMVPTISITGQRSPSSWMLHLLRCRNLESYCLVMKKQLASMWDGSIKSMFFSSRRLKMRRRIRV